MKPTLPDWREQGSYIADAQTAIVYVFPKDKYINGSIHLVAMFHDLLSYDIDYISQYNPVFSTLRSNPYLGSISSHELSTPHYDVFNDKYILLTFLLDKVFFYLRLIFALLC